jgi:PKD repeat protein
MHYSNDTMKLLKSLRITSPFVMFFALLLLMGIGVKPVSASIWQIETVDSAGGYNSLSLDPTTGYPRISYSDNGLKYAAYDGSTWHTETVDSAGDVGICNSLALDPTTGYPRISYYDAGSWCLKYSTYDGSTWHIETVDSARIVGWSISLAMDPTTGYPRISYYDSKNKDLKYASYDGSTWHTLTVDSVGEAGSDNSLALDPTTGYPRISYYDATNDDLKYAFLLPDNQSPSITGITVPVDPVFVNTEVSISGTFTDQDTADTHTAVWDWGDSATSDCTVTEGDDTVNGLHTYTTPGIYTVTLTVTDSSGASDTETAETYIVIYDPTGGFVTGGGWFDSPSGAYRGNPTLTGKADFEFVSKYQKGATVPEGNTQFKFKTADLKFDITSYKWLVVNKAGMNAQFSGQGTINGGLAPNNEEYKFMIWATDGNSDTFRIKIWWEDNSVENIVYDNDIEQPIGGGAIKVHTK